TACARYYLPHPPTDMSGGPENPGSGPKMQVLTKGHLSLVARDHPDGPPAGTEQACDPAAGAAGAGGWPRPVGAFTGSPLVVLDAQLNERQSTALTGFPNRTRVSPSGRMAAWSPGHCS